MEQAYELLAMIHAREALVVEKPPTIEAHQIEVAQPRAEPLSFLTGETVEGIVGDVDFDATQGQSAWQTKMEKFMSMGHAY